jgi:hypothetical protein
MVGLDQNGRAMRYLLVLCCLSIGCFAQSIPSDWGFIESGNNFVRICESTLSKPVKAITSVCLAYVTGVVNGAHAAFLLDGSKEGAHAFCGDGKVTDGQIYEIAFKYIKDHPEHSREQTRWLVITAMLEAFPCHHH